MSRARTNRTGPAPKKASKTGRRKSKTTTTGSDRKPVVEPRDGYAHKAKEANRLPTSAELAEVDLGGDYSAGKTPDVVMYGRRLQVLSLMVRGEPTFNIVEYCQRAFHMTPTQTRYLVHEIRTAWRNDAEEQVAYSRAEAIMRLRRDLSDLRSAAKKDWSAINRHEALLAKIEGTIQPVKVNVFDGNAAMRDALGAVLSTMSNEDLEVFATVGEELEAANLLPSAAE